MQKIAAWVAPYLSQCKVSCVNTMARNRVPARATTKQAVLTKVIKKNCRTNIREAYSCRQRSTAAFSVEPAQYNISFSLP